MLGLISAHQRNQRLPLLCRLAPVTVAPGYALRDAALLVGFSIFAAFLGAGDAVADTLAMAGAFSGAKVRIKSVRVTMPSMTPRALTTGRPPTWLSSISLAASLAVMSGFAVTTLRRM